MKIFVDADACPVIKIIEEVATKYRIDVIIVANNHHLINSSYAEVITTDYYPQAVDIYITNHLSIGDIVVTQDYGLASLILGKGGKAIHPRGCVYNYDNIDRLLLQRYLNLKARQAGQRIKNQAKRKNKDDNYFREKLIALLEENLPIE